MITVHHESWVATLEITKRLDKEVKFFSVGKKSFLGVMSKLLQLYIGGVWPNDYSITWGGGEVCPNDYNITWGVSQDPQK